MSENIRLEGRQSLRRNRMPAWSQIVHLDGWIRIGILAGLVAVAYFGEINRLRHTWTEQQDWMHGWLIPVISIYVLHINRDRLAKVPIRPSLLGVPVMLFAAAIYLGGFAMRVGYPRPFSLLFMLAGMVLLMGGWGLLRICWFPIALLVFAIPLPEVQYFQATLPLRKMVTLLSTGFLNLLPDVHATPEGTVVNYIHGATSGQLDVAEACSGMRSLMAFLAIGSIMAYLMREKPVWHRLVLLALCVPISIFCNFIRVTITSVLQVYGYRSLATGGAHTALGLGMMVLALSLFGVANWALSAAVKEGDEPAEPAGGRA
jgi:exosortase